jgi:cell wall-associated NlpC family hydrolase
MRIAPDHRSEMISQLLFGEYCSLEQESNGWVKLVNRSDAYSGWCRRSQLLEIEAHLYQDRRILLSREWVSEVIVDGNKMHVPFGSSFLGLKDRRIKWGEHVVEFSGKLWNPAKMKQDAETIRQLAFTFLNTGYLWGGRSVFGIDCSGFTQSVYRFLGVDLRRDANQQAMQGVLVDSLAGVQCGDLAFFENCDGQIVHVGLLLNGSEIIHAAGKVRVDRIDKNGIINADGSHADQRLRFIKRFLK